MKFAFLCVGVVEHDQLDCLLETSWKLKCELVTRREIGTSDAIKLQNQESLHSLEVFVSRGRGTLLR